MRDTFMKVAQSLIVKKQLVNEKSIKEKMIHSVMPPKVADWLMNEGHAEGMDDAMFGADGGGKNAGGTGGPAAANAATATAGAAGKSEADRKKGSKSNQDKADGGEESGDDDSDLFELSEEDSESG
jgi:hypothetical protein